MTKLLALLCLLFAFSAVNSTDCSYTANLRSFYGFNSNLASPKTYSDLKYCNSLKSSAVCCTDTEINSIADSSNEYIQNITTLVSTRDKYITTVKDTLLSQIQTDIDNFNTVSKQFLLKFTQMMEGSDSGSDIGGSDDGGSDDFDLLDSFSYITNLTSAFVANIADIKADYGTYQSTRRTCVLEMVDLQNAAMCLSCDPNAANTGFVDNTAMIAEIIAEAMSGGGSSPGESDSSDEYDGESMAEYLAFLYENLFYFNIDPTVCERLQTACKPYIKVAQGQNMIIEAALAVDLLVGLTSAMQSFNNGNYETAFDEMSNLFNVTDSEDIVTALAIGVLPDDCDVDGECEWICNGLFIDGMVDGAALIVGGDYELTFEGSADGRRRILSENRKLGSSSTSTHWAPKEGESGVAVSFAVDPAGTTQKKFGSLNLGNVFVGMMVVISSILLF